MADAANRSVALAASARLFAAAVEMDAVAYGFFDFVYDYCRVLRRLGRAREADAVFAAARTATGDAFPWGGPPGQMPCCGTLAPPALLPPRGEAGWHDAAAHDAARALSAHADEIRSEAARALEASPLAFASLEGHGVEVVGGRNGAALGPLEAPWKELVLFSSDGGWAHCDRFPKLCAALANLPSVVGAPAAVAGAAGRGDCCRVELLRLDANSVILPHTAPTNVRLKAHLAIAAPPGDAASLTVNGERRAFANGTVLCFDDSFWHEARNDHATAPRVILSVDFWKPGLLPTITRRT